jgi:uncharacterized membrane protein
MVESHKRSIVKAITWRVIATVIAYLWVGLEAAIIINIIQTIAYYIHERIWVHIKWGRHITKFDIDEQT